MNTTRFSVLRGRRGGSVAPVALFGIVALGLIGFGIYFVSSETSAATIDPILATVEQGEFVAQVLDQGEIQSSENIEIRCEVRARNGTITVIEVVPEGTRVKAGDFLVRLDSTSFEKELETQKISVANAETAVIQADAEFRTAEVAKREYVEGLFVEQKKLIENDIYNAEGQRQTAMQNLTLAKADLNHSKKLQAKGFVTTQQLKAKGFAVKEAEIAQKAAENQVALTHTQLQVLENITKMKELIKLESDIEAAKVKLANQKESLLVEKGKLDEIKTQIAKCEVRVPEGVEGQVVYAKESSYRGDDWALEEGASVRERQVLIRLPNPDKMEVKALINEQSITRIQVGMPASINVDALSNDTLTGIVTKVNQYAESGGWMSSSIRKYAVLVEILDPPKALKPGMNAAVTIEVQHESDAVKTPIQTVYAVQDRHFCLVKKGENQWETREIDVEGDNSQEVLVKAGLQPGETLVMNPGAFKDLMELPELEVDKKIEISDAMKSKIDALRQDIKAQTVPAVEQTAGSNTSGQGGSRPSRAGGSGRPSFDLPANGAALIKQKDQDGDGKLTKDEAGTPYSYFFERIDTDGDGFVNETEADASIARSRKMMQQGGGNGGGGGGR